MTRLRSLSSQKPIDFAVPCNQARDLRARQFDKQRAQHNVVAEIVYADRDALERHKWRRSSQIWQRRLVGRPPEPKNGNSRHPWQDFYTEVADLKRTHRG